MIVDQLDRLNLYAPLSPRIAAAAKWAAETDLAALPLGRNEIDGDTIFANAMTYPSKPDAEAVWEAHRRYIDIQIILSGAERICVGDLSQMTVTTPHDSTKDVAFFTGHSGQWITLSAGQFAIFYPHDVHRPCVQVAGHAEQVHKVVIKVEV